MSKKEKSYVWTLAWYHPLSNNQSMHLQAHVE